MRGENVPVIFGLKLRNLREQRGYGLKEFSELAGMSPSYLTEIEKGKKYPKADKILQLAQALQVPYDDMVSLKLGEKLHPLESFLDSPILQLLPLQMFGLSPRDILDLISRAPKEVSAFIHTLVEIAGSYDMHVEHFFYAMLRSYQQTHDNYFEDIEIAVARFLQTHGRTPPVSAEGLSAVLQDEYAIDIDEQQLARYPELSGFRSVWIPGPPERLLINPRLNPMQKAFQVGREIGYRDLRLKVRGTTSSRAEVDSFEQVLNDFKASYYAGALMIDQAELTTDLTGFLPRKRWNGDAFLTMMNRYQVTPEMFLYRLTQIIPKQFGLKHFHFLRVNQEPPDGPFRVSKQFNMSELLIPTGIGWTEHHCRRWNPLGILHTLAVQQQSGRTASPIIAAQRARFIHSQSEYFVLSLARPLTLTPGTNTSVTLGFELDTAFKDTVGFWDDPAVPRIDVNESCERCDLSASACDQRVAPPRLHEQKQALEARNRQLAQLLAEMKAS